MTQDIAGIDVTVEFTDGTKSTGHLSPGGVHSKRKARDERLTPILSTLRESVADRFRPWKAKS